MKTAKTGLFPHGEKANNRVHWIVPRTHIGCCRYNRQPVDPIAFSTPIDEVTFIPLNDMDRMLTELKKGDVRSRYRGRNLRA